MAQLLADRRDIDFVLWEQFKVDTFLGIEAFREYDKKTCRLIIDEARKLAIKEVLPTMAEGDRVGVYLEKGAVTVPACFRKPFELLLEGNWNNLGVAQEIGGQGAPAFISAATSEYFMAANWALYCYATMGDGTALLIHKYGTEEQKQLFLGPLVAAKWGGTMLLTESEAGSDVGALTTTAVRQSDGSFLLSGNKIFITNGEHDLAQNIIHPVLARIEGDPPGTKGISIFIVPKFLVNPDGSIGERNDIVCTGIEEKHGIHGSATCSMALGTKGHCIGYLLGEERRGLRIMFHMINGARMGTGLQALSYASAAYLLSVDYAKKRVQGRDLAHFRDVSEPSIPIIGHPDVRRNLLWMKSYVDGMRSFFYYTVGCGLSAQFATDEKNRELLQGYYAMLTPIIKEYIAFHGHEVCIQAIQVFGGAGYTRDYLVEQYARDCKITTIYEGTSGIQAMDLLARKIGEQNGAVFAYFLKQIQSTTAETSALDHLSDLSAALNAAAERLTRVALSLGQKAMSVDYQVAFAHSLPFLHVMGDVIVAWMLLWRAATAAKLVEGVKGKKQAFYQGQMKTAEFFIRTVLPIALGKMDAIEDGCAAAVEIEAAGFVSG